MSTVVLERLGDRTRLGLKGPQAAHWLAAQDIALPVAANSWRESPQGATDEAASLVARLGTAEFFLEDGPQGATVRRIAPGLHAHPHGVYPVLREDWAFVMHGAQVHEALAQVCSVNFADLSMEAQPLIMTLMIGVAVLIVPQNAPAGRRYRIWCDPTFGQYLGESLGTVAIECGGSHTGVSA